jgi:hypothetical protein
VLEQITMANVGRYLFERGWYREHFDPDVLEGRQFWSKAYPRGSEGPILLDPSDPMESVLTSFRARGFDPEVVRSEIVSGRSVKADA